MIRKLLLICLILVLTGTGSVFAVDGQIVRIGLTYQDNAYNNGTVAGTAMTLESAEGAVALRTDRISFSPITASFVRLESVDDNTLIESAADWTAKGFDAVLLAGDGLSLGLGPFSDSDAAQSALVASGSSVGSVVRCSGILLQGSMVPVIVTDPAVTIQPANGLLSYTGRTYRGAFSFALIDGQISVVNRIAVSEYLKSVVPNEMDESWPVEALKAQAIVARTYLLSNLGRFSHLGFDLTDTSSSQVYTGVGAEHRSTTQAVEETIGQVVTYGGTLIHAYYHASSGGITASSENVWSAAVPYLRSVDDAYSFGAPNATWSLEWTAQQLTTLLQENGYGISAVASVEIVDVSPDGRVQDLRIVTDRGAIDLVKEEARQILGYNRLKSIYYTVSGNGNFSLRTSFGTEQRDLAGTAALSAGGLETVSTQSSAMTASGVRSLTAVDSVFQFSGQGWGHGVGLSQWGAKTMAEAGYTAEEIISHYYSGVSIETR